MDFDKIIEESDKPYNIRHRCYYFAREVIQFVKCSKYDKVFHSLFDQLVRCSTSIGSNLVEGTAGSSKKDWMKFLIIALKSANETKYWLCLVRDTLDTDKNRVNELLSEATEISNIIARIILNASKE